MEQGQKLMVTEGGCYGTTLDLTEIERTIFAAGFWYVIGLLSGMLKRMALKTKERRC